MSDGFVIFKHPEIKDDEWLFCNVEKDKEWTVTGSNHRFGRIAYNRMGYVIDKHIPVFVRRRDER